MSLPFIWPVRVYFEDTDAGGVVFYGNYLKFFERARTEWLRSLGIGQQCLKETCNILFVVKNISVEYKRSAVLDDELRVITTVSRIGGASIGFEQTIRRDETVIATAAVTIVCVDRITSKPVPIPEKVATRIRDDLGRN